MPEGKFLSWRNYINLIGSVFIAVLVGFLLMAFTPLGLAGPLGAVVIIVIVVGLAVGLFSVTHKMGQQT
jgi:F0F1-type ATP synthase assembly protein I